MLFSTCNSPSSEVASAVHEAPPRRAVDVLRSLREHDRERFTKFLARSQGGQMHARFLGKDPDSQVDNSPTLFATDRTDRVTYIAQGWKVTDPQVLADVG